MRRVWVELWLVCEELKDPSGDSSEQSQELNLCQKEQFSIETGSLFRR